jgi:hypothetical protein
MSDAMSPAEALDAAIDGLYSLFAQYKLANIASRSPYAEISDEKVAKLQSRPLRELTVSDLDRYMRSALVTWGDVPEFKHFLPRILELTARDPFAIDPLVFEKLDLAEWKTWPKVEQDAVDVYIAALWRRTLTLSPDAANAGDLLRGLGLAGYDLERWIDIWRNERGQEATEQLAQFVLNIGNGLTSGTMPRQWHPKDHAAVVSFLLDPETKSRIEAAFMEAPDRESARRLADASDILARVPQRS